jgi:hypothetical protein
MIAIALLNQLELNGMIGCSISQVSSERPTVFLELSNCVDVEFLGGEGSDVRWWGSFSGSTRIRRPRIPKIPGSHVKRKLQ